MVTFFDQSTLREACSLMGKLEASKGYVLSLLGCRWRIWSDCSRRIQHWKNIVGEKDKGGKEFFYCDALLSQEWQPKRGSSVQGPVEQLVLLLGCRGVPWFPYRSCPHHLISLPWTSLAIILHGAEQEIWLCVTMEDAIPRGCLTEEYRLWACSRRIVEGVFNSKGRDSKWNTRWPGSQLYVQASR